MLIGLICDDPFICRRLLESLSRSRQKLVATLIPAALDIELQQFFPSIRRHSSIEALIADNEIDAIIVSICDAKKFDELKVIVANAAHVLLLPSYTHTLDLLYEITLIKDEKRTQIIPFFEDRYDAALIAYRSRINANPTHLQRHLQFERVVNAESHSYSISFAETDRFLTHDIPAIEWLTGDHSQVTTVRTGVNNDSALTQSVTLSGSNSIEASWVIRSSTQPEARRITTHTADGVISAEFDLQERSWKFTEEDGREIRGSFEDSLQRFLDEADPLNQKTSAPQTNWCDLVKAFEIIEATHRSARRRRTIELLFEPVSERSTFKTQMTAIGCGIIVLTLLLILGYLGIASLVPSQPSQHESLSEGWHILRKVLNVARFLIFAPLGIFLALQLLYPLTQSGTSARKQSPPESTQDSDDIED